MHASAPGPRLAGSHANFQSSLAAEGDVRTAIVVLGMHRSGTSALAGMLSILGSKLPATLMGANKANPRGYFESERIRDLNDRLLASADSAWNDWRKFDEDWYASDDAAAYRHALAPVLQTEFGGADFMVIKEPRACRFAPFWLSALQQQRIATKVAIPVRNPIEVARSLRKRSRRKRDGLVPTMLDGLCLWLRHCLDAEASTRRLPRTIVPYENLLADWRGAVSLISARLDIAFPTPPEEVGHKVEAFLSPALRRHRSCALPYIFRGRLERFVLDAHSALVSLAHDDREGSGTRARLDEIRATFDECCARHHPRGPLNALAPSL